MKKRALFIVCLGLVMLLGVVLGCEPSAPPEEEPAETPEEALEDEIEMEPVNLELAHFWPGDHLIETEVIEPWAEAVEEATDGLVTVTTYPGGTLLEADDIYDGVSEGIADMGISFFSYTPGRFPVIELLELPGINYNNAIVASNVAWDFIQQMDPEEVHDTKLMFVGSGGLAHLGTNEPVRSVEDLEGMELRTTGGSTLPVEASDGVPVAMPMSEAYESLQRGVVQGILGPTAPLETWRLAEVVDYVTKTPFMYTAIWFFNINLETWESFPTEVQDIILEINEEIFEEGGMRAFQDSDETGLEFAVEEEGVEVIELEEDEAEKWINLFDPVREKHTEEAEEQGLPGQEAAELVEELAEEYNELY